MTQKLRMNIATSCNDAYSRFVFVNLQNVHEIFGKKYDLHFYLIQSDIADQNIEELTDFSDKLNLTFHNVMVQDDDFLKKVVRYSRAHDTARFFDGACHLFLPEDVDRVLFVDTGDFLFLSNEYDFYFKDFEGKSLLLSTYWRLEKDPWNFDRLTGMWGGFNSGHMLINLDRLRKKEISADDYVKYAESWARHFPEQKVLYGGDQAFLTGFFAGEMATIERSNPYNVKVVDLNGEAPTSPPKSVHLNALFGNIKPWEIPFNTPNDLKSYKMIVPNEINSDHGQVYFSDVENSFTLKWWDICSRTPVYNELKEYSFHNLKLTKLFSKKLNSLSTSHSSSASRAERGSNDERVNKQIDQTLNEGSLQMTDELEKIKASYNRPDPEIAYICSGLRRISVDPSDRRVRKILLTRGVRGRSREQHFFFRMMDEFDIDLFLDIGANYGECAMSAPLYCSTKIVGYEANSKLIPFLQKSSLYNDDIKNLEWRNLAVGNTPGENLSFFIDEDWSGKSSVVRSSESELTKVKVLCTSIDHEMENLGGGNESLLIKLDIEGYEPAALDGAKQTLQGSKNIVILMEFDSEYIEAGGQNSEMFFNELKENFNVFELKNNADIITADSYHHLNRIHRGKKVHTDLVLTRNLTPSFYGKFVNSFVGKNIYS
ncbi:FkbM family methyltransferase [Lutimaribacter sp. EGI FJ00015]|uniref:FkbM family methyltransferase n=1 Tax=Lutimaribacter degradans TaxID=2945989 RepID=A0ACC6A0I9_9RHOB|nr:FkbM family methyltransferase [Lutimaribacter sp. EGI FJ00013]MCM2563950.1 FkbM family methyltransferase [Lutimaribacter sp. EGI FJ00013]MCO0615211.1 FkbM family methyltransferase [Lutimaribacter sp. EGI FJ00015]MCO0637804.1 FkbM family methyltransferase [Lutimaribacter sp. EGI FJ00014]